MSVKQLYHIFNTLYFLIKIIINDIKIKQLIEILNI